MCAPRWQSKRVVDGGQWTQWTVDNGRELMVTWQCSSTRHFWPQSV
ncbi:predicted protein [Plenodomus lingam JN3]|uniref:Predicted protein n=1 Tax=Leptosphaeria maculans (strain JN3 / isolate v23.1.3 / race Av1-4-5-6-7-8) TaxID=985895 RepID=E5ABH1_LEPMJ|nr:predicted protein [Plenodomus lingam JN3]CBY01012.1 predicted protein [Plenodomus lingam JN3]